jgi:hypothetical protein
MTIDEQARELAERVNPESPPKERAVRLRIFAQGKIDATTRTIVLRAAEMLDDPEWPDHREDN